MMLKSLDEELSYLSHHREYRHLSPRLIETLHRYVYQGIPTGSFVESVLSNNLKEAIGRADMQNRAALPVIVTYIVSRLPMAAQGSPDIYRDWIVMHMRKRTEGDKQ